MKPVIEILAQITADKPRFAAGIVLWDDKVIEAAPIVRRALKGKTRAFVRQYCQAKGWKISVVHQVERYDTIYKPV